MRSYYQPNQKHHKTLYIIYSILPAAILSLLLCISNTYADNVDYNVIVEPALNITTSGDTNGIVSLDLNPETHPFDSKDLNVSVSTNNETGYKLYVNTLNNTTNLVEKNDSSLVISTLDSNGNVGYTESTFTPNRWGYKLTTTSNFFPFIPGTLISSSKTYAEDINTTITFGAKADYTTKAGSYDLALNFQATANPHIYYIQDFTNDMCSTFATDNAVTVIDKRDDQEYTVRYINGNCWMTQNLRFTGTELSSSTSNVAPTYTDASPYKINSTGTWGDLTSGDSTTQARMHIGTDSNNNPTAWYNYTGASAGTITGSSASGITNYTICPKNWTLPNDSQLSAIISYKNLLNLVWSGYYYNQGLIGHTDYGIWWSATLRGGTTAGRLLMGSSGTVQNDGGHRRDGVSIRCIRSS